MNFRKAAFDGTALTGLSGWLRGPDVLQTVVAMPEAGWDPANVKTLALSQVDPACCRRSTTSGCCANTPSR